MFRRDDLIAVEELEQVILRNGGCMTRCAHDLVISRRHLYRLIYRANLWDVVDAARTQVVAVPDEIARARQEV